MASSATFPGTAILIGQPQTLRRLEQQLDLIEPRPVSVGWVLMPPVAARSIDDGDGPVLGTIDELESIVARRPAAVALISLPATMKDAIANIRTRLRRLGLPDRFMPTLEDQIRGIGPRTNIDIDLAALLDRPPRQIDEGAVRDVIEGRRVLITGAGGSIGSELCRIVARFNPAQLVMVERSENALFEIDRQIAWRHADLPRRALLHDVVDKAATLAHFHAIRPQVVFHAAAHKHVPMMEEHPAAAVDNNLFGTAAVADACDAVGVERLVFISTDKAVNPVSIMGATKRLAEVYVQSINQRSSMACAIVRFGNVLGSSGSVLDTWARQIADGGPITVTDPRMTRYFMTIPEAAALVIQSAALVTPDSRHSEVFLLDMGEPFRIVDLARRFAAQHGLRPVMPGEDTVKSGAARTHTAAGTIGIVFTGTRPGEKLFEELAFNAQYMQPTRHKDINIWSLPDPDPRYVGNMMDRLAKRSRPSKPQALAAEIRRLIPESNHLTKSASLSATAT
jgi:FlaA1/EpsC-like NDP-sugar epimerase